MSPEVLAVCQQLIKSGKPVSVGMLKARLPVKTPLPAIIQAVQYCKQQPQAVVDAPPANTESVTKPNESSEAQKIMELETRIEALEKRLAVLEQKD
ncbi:hypothetical protein [Planctobacterium marinum]|uniref:KfrA N-terminal DNA-binding domain-containing protein n=1 Tax=Planctobacterium marinum TaxID=1631968 RepID=A0AA48KRJ3_9ALTE|nr:hypothetical protein MACH26_31590 [Planctobacterium marinum]